MIIWAGKSCSRSLVRVYMVEIGQVFYGGVSFIIIWYCVERYSDFLERVSLDVILGYDGMVFLGMMVWYYVSWNVLKRPTQPRSYSYHQLLTQT